MPARRTLSRATAWLPSKARDALRSLLPTSAPRPGRVSLGDLRRLEPISREFGYDRGQPIDRFYIEGFLARHASDIHGNVLEIGDSSYTRQFGGIRVAKAEALHVPPAPPEARYVGDLTDPSLLPDEAFDCFIFTQTLHLIYDFRAALVQAHRVLRPGGVLLATFPGISQMSSDQWANDWCWAFTRHSAYRLFSEAFGPDAIEVTGYGSVLTATAFLQGLATSELRPDELAHHDPQFEMLLSVRAQKRAEPTLTTVGDRL